MKTYVSKLIPLVLSMAALGGCSTSNGTSSDVVALTITAVSMPATATARQPVTYTATVQLVNTKETFDHFSSVRGVNPYTFVAIGKETGGGAAETHSEDHTGTVTFPTAGTYQVDFTNSSPPVSATVTVH